MRVFALLISMLAASVSAMAGMQEADQALAAKDYPKAIAAYQEILAEDGSNVRALRQLGMAFYYSGDLSRSLGAYEALLVKEPGDAATQRFVDSLKGKGVSPASYLPESPSAPVPEPGDRRPKYGIRAGLGLGLPLSTGSVGYDYSTGSPYPYDLGAGMTYGSEILWAFQAPLELGLGTQLISNSQSFSSKNHDGTQESSTKASSSVMTVDLTLYGVIPASPKLDWILGFGPAIALGGNRDVSTDSKTSSGITSKFTEKTVTEMGLGYHAVLGAEYKFNNSFSVMAGLDLEAVNVMVAKVTTTQLNTTSSGVVFTDDVSETEYVASPPKFKATSFIMNGTVSTTDDGVTVSTYDSATGKSTSKTKRAKTYSLDFNRIAPVLRVTYRF